MATDDIGGGFYAAPHLYDILVTPGTAAEADVLETVVRRLGRVPDGRLLWLEPACGPGRLLRVLAGRGHRVVGFDINPAMVADARARLRRRGLARRARILEGDLVDCGGLLPPGSADAAFTTDNSLRHLTDDRGMHDHFAGIARLLKPGGVYVVGISLTRPGGEPPEEDVWTAARGRCRVTQVVNYLPPGEGGAGPRFERVVSHLMVTRPRGVEHLDHVYDLRTYSPRQWESLVGRSALQRIASLDRDGLPRGRRDLLYQYEVLAPRAGTVRRSSR